METKVKLNKSKSLQEGNKNTSLRVDLSNNNIPLMEDEVVDVVDEYSQYLMEREACDKIRLTTQVNIMASNCLFNGITEIVKGEGSDNCVCLNFNNNTPISGVLGKESTYFTENTYPSRSKTSNCMRDTQITSQKHGGFTYLPGLDIFNNHTLRSNSSTPIVYASGDTKMVYGEPINRSLNTINDFVRDVITHKYGLFGKKFLNIVYKTSGMNDPWWIHLYTKGDIPSSTMTESLNENLKEKNGWLGFLNKSKMISCDMEGNDIDIAKVLNNEQANKFIEMYPNSTHFDFLPHYNKSRHRKEKNWEYCLCYPYSSTTENIPCVDENGRLKIVLIDESDSDADGLVKTMIMSSCKHGLNPGDTINIYNKNGNRIIENAIIDTIIDEYSFYIYLGENLSNDWVSVYDYEGTLVRLGYSSDEIQTIVSSACDTQWATDGVNEEGVYEPHLENGIWTWDNLWDDDKPQTHEEALAFVKPEYISFDGYDILGNTFKSKDGVVYHSYNDRINFDDEAQDLTFCRTVNDKECKYYVRIFSRMPNFDFMEGPVNEDTIYKENNGIVPVEEYAKAEYEHQSIASKLSYAKNVYNDHIHQIVYTDDIHFNNLYDNLGRPLSTIYLCFFKTNYGYKQWYNGYTTSSKVEHSHCFGKLNCGLDLAPNADIYGYKSGNTRVMNNVDEGYVGLSQTILRGEVDNMEEDEIDFNHSNLFYGDLCEYSEYECMERILQPIIHRFNTQQRELKGSQLSTKSALSGKIEFDYIVYDDYEITDNPFTVSSYTLDYEALAQKEGYVYQSAHEIPLRSWSSQIKTFKPLDLELYSIEQANGLYTVTTSKPHRINKDFKIVLHDIKNKKHYMCVIDSIVSLNVFTCTISDRFGRTPDLTYGVEGFRLYKSPDTIPDYVTLSDDKDGIFRWRYLLANGFEDTAGVIEEYPFTNNSLYVNRLINLYVRRQDPFSENGLSEPFIESLQGIRSEVESTDAYITFKEKDTIC